MPNAFHAEPRLKFQVSATVEDYQAIERAARRLGKSVSGAVRDSALGRAPPLTAADVVTIMPGRFAGGRWNKEQEYGR